ncbi:MULTISPECIES: hypothetical protein [Aeromonas]|uniref:hypothetical protein n=1 Tax=Aeromonas TaxID=642 RepID=UPI00080ABBD2|nr:MULTISPECIES: hypothetical protein [Aeromonas]ANT70183.1 hypothetical protein TK34_22140 [Aeromonas hydrophila]MDH0348209.1 hypothetical protein [Aeromonas dhakensis]
MAKRFAIKSPKGDYRFFTSSPKETRDRFMDTKEFGDDWGFYRSMGYSLVQVDIRVTAVIDGADGKGAA